MGKCEGGKYIEHHLLQFCEHLRNCWKEDSKVEMTQMYAVGIYKGVRGLRCFMMYASFIHANLRSTKTCFTCRHDPRMTRSVSFMPMFPSSRGWRWSTRCPFEMPSWWTLDAAAARRADSTRRRLRWRLERTSRFGADADHTGYIGDNIIYCEKTIAHAAARR